MKIVVFVLLIVSGVMALLGDVQYAQYFILAAICFALLDKAG